jgi:hypothetical protein
MDPYLERSWRDVHADLVAQARAALNQVLPGDLIARMEERVVIDNVQELHSKVIYPDVRVYENPDQIQYGAPEGGASAVAEPIILEVPLEQPTEQYVTVVEAEGGQLVTVIEVLSPTNKLPGKGRDEYRQKRDELNLANVNLVELDLIRAGDWRELLFPAIAPAQSQTPYRAIVRRIHPKRRIELYPISLRTRLPKISIPLRLSDKDVILDLQSLVDEVYDRGRYDRINYNRPPEPPLEEPDQAWGEELLRAAGRRRSS